MNGSLTDWLFCRECNSNYSYWLETVPTRTVEFWWRADTAPAAGQLVKVTEGMILRDDKYIVPEALQKPVIKLYHDYAHVSAPKTQQLIQKNFWWPQWHQTFKDGGDTCIVCATINQDKPGRTKLCRPEPPKGPWELLQSDFIGPLPSAKGGYRYCPVIIDKFSKWVRSDSHPQ